MEGTFKGHLVQQFIHHPRHPR